MTSTHCSDSPPATASAARGVVAAYRIGDVLLDLDRRSIWRAGQEVPLVGLSFDLLLALVRSAPDTVPVAALMREVWPGLVVGADTLSQRIKLVRAALGDNAEQPRYIANVRARGYRLIAPIEPLAAMPVAKATATSPRVRTSSSMHRPRLVMGVLLGAAALAITAFMFSGRQHAMTDDQQALAIYQRARPEVRSLGVTDSPEHAVAIEEQLSTAIRRDSRFGLAHVERFNVRALRFMFSWGEPETLMAQMLEDLDAVRRLMPGSAELAAAEGAVASFNQDYELAIARYDAAEAAGLVDPHEAMMRAGMMAQMGRLEAALPLIDRAIRLQEHPAQKLLLKGVMQSYLRRPSEAMQSFREAAALGERPDFLAAGLIGYTRYQFTGVASAVPPPTIDAHVARGEIGEARRLAGSQPERAAASIDAGMLIPVGAGALPLRALSQGRVALLSGDSQGAVRAGRAVLAFVSGERETRYNRWFLKNLAATGLLLEGRTAAAIHAAHEALELAPRSASAINWAIAAARAATTLAWAGAHEEALDLLEELAEAMPGLPPAEISRSLELRANLAANARYQALVHKLEARMALTRL